MRTGARPSLLPSSGCACRKASFRSAGAASLVKGKAGLVVADHQDVDVGAVCSEFFQIGGETFGEVEEVHAGQDGGVKDQEHDAHSDAHDDGGALGLFLEKSF